jgi:hypothetical protein
MESAGWCRAMAAGCMWLAHGAPTVELRAQWIARAEAWRRLADQPAGYDEQPRPGGLSDGRPARTAPRSGVPG